MKKRILSMLLAAIMLVSVLGGCDNAKTPGGPSSGVTVSIPKDGWPESWRGDEFSKKAPSVEKFNGKPVDVSAYPKTDYFALREMLNGMSFSCDSDRIARRYTSLNSEIDMDKIVGELDDIFPAEGRRSFDTENKEFSARLRNWDISLRAETGFANHIKTEGRSEDQITIQVSLRIENDDYGDSLATYLYLLKSLGHHVDEQVFSELVACIWRDFKGETSFLESKGYELDLVRDFRNGVYLRFWLSGGSLTVDFKDSQWRSNMAGTGIETVNLEGVTIPSPSGRLVYGAADAEDTVANMLGELAVSVDEQTSTGIHANDSLEQMVDNFEKLFPYGYYVTTDSRGDCTNDYDYKDVTVESPYSTNRITGHYAAKVHSVKRKDMASLTTISLKIDREDCEKEIEAFLSIAEGIGIHLDREKLAQMVADVLQWCRESYEAGDKDQAMLSQRHRIHTSYGYLDIDIEARTEESIELYEYSPHITILLNDEGHFLMK